MILTHRTLNLVAALTIMLSIMSIWTTHHLMIRVVMQKDNHAYGYTNIGTIHAASQVLERQFRNQVQITVEETVRYRFPSEEAPMEWYSSYPLGFGTFRIANQKTLFVSMVHQYHCIETFGRQLTRTNRTRDWGHLHHCLNYIREMVLCHPDLTLEPGDFSTRNFTIDRIGATHTCRDLSPVYDALGRNWKEWTEFQKSHTL
ncbi:hypothetical protein C8J56DRAFT_506558 [Mycena floridula]|nr:hypothetical protein C8J56DRAFT_517289 [Mycena floridula]KAJ7573797.1 hypothetical protein C8J56DRAFT_506558 [Mycena floridula]